MLRVACDEEAVVEVDGLFEGGEAVNCGIAGIVFIVDAFRT